jgi:hypothetical protein
MAFPTNRNIYYTIQRTSIIKLTWRNIPIPLPNPNAKKTIDHFTEMSSISSRSDGILGS